MVLAGSLLAAGPPAAAQDTDDVTAPTTPEIELLGDPPQAGEPVTLRFTASDADSGLDGFWYGINEEVKRAFVAAPAPAGETGSAEVTFPAPVAGGRVFVYVWAEDVAGNSSNRAIFDFFVQPETPPPPEAVRIAGWPLDSDIGTIDVVGDNHLTLSGVEGTDYDWVEDRFCFPESALDLPGPAGHAATAGAVVATDLSFSVAAWVVPGAPAGDDQTVLSQSGPTRPAVLLQQTAEESWRFAVPNLNPMRPDTGVVETAPGSVLPGVWNHLAGVVDLVEGEIRLYVNGELAATGVATATPWPARGPFYVGVAGSLRGTDSPFTGTVDDVGLWSGRLLASQIRDLGIGGGMGLPCF